jgi:8-amino-7-oxononanoate synthase
MAYRQVTGAYTVGTMVDFLNLPSHLSRLRDEGLYRRRRIIDGPQGTVLTLEDGRHVLSFCSNDYLGLAADPRIAEAFKRGIDQYGSGSGAAHLVTGHSTAHHALEEELAEFTGRPRALLFSTGYMANLAVVATLTGRGDTVLEDRLNHASLLDAGLLSGARLIRYAHADDSDLRRRLAERERGAKLVVTDGVFSMDGDLAPLPQLAETTMENGAWLMVDDAHGLGVLGKRGGGCLEHFGLGMEQVPVLMGTLGKALGTAGAFVAGPGDLIEFLIQKARPYIYTTASPPALAEATRTALRIAREEHWRREHLTSLITRLRGGLEELAGRTHLRLMQSPTPIQPLVVGDAAKAVRLSNALLERGILISAIRPPTVPEGTARLRITLSAVHTETQVDRLLETLAEAMPAE